MYIKTSGKVLDLPLQNKYSINFYSEKPYKWNVLLPDNRHQYKKGMQNNMFRLKKHVHLSFKCKGD